MAGEQYRHIFLPGPDRTEGFTNPRSGGNSPSIPQRDRNQHSIYLRNRINYAWNAVDQQRRAISHTERRGVYIDFIGEPGSDLIIKSLEARRSGIRLCNVREDGEEEKQVFATVYIPNEKRGHFLRKIEAYASEETKTGKPKNNNLINSVSDIRLSVLESFWQDDNNLIPRDTPVWVEVWLSTDQDDKIEQFKSLLSEQQIEQSVGIIKFPERTVLMIFANQSQLQQIILYSDDIAEFRLSKEVASFFIELENRDQVQRAQDLLARTEILENTDIAVCILDSGVNNGHMLIKPLLANEDLHTVNPNWGTNDHGGHGTLMAGTAAFGDLLNHLSSSNNILISHHLESSKILPPPPEVNPKELWGYFTAQGIYRAEIHKPDQKRIGCLAVSSTDFRDRGRPSSWSGALDEITSGYEDDKKRLIVVSAGNIEDVDSWCSYFDDNLTNEVHDPGQAWNVLTIGAFTEKINIQDRILQDYQPIAPPGGLSPFSTTSLTWPSTKWPIKPDVLFEGGNVARGPNNSVDTEELGLLSTFYQPNVAQFAEFNATSAASGQASWMAAKIQAMYPEAWPETIRALIVHNAEWTNTMKDQFLSDESKTSYSKLLRICGYGVPNLERALYCASNSLTLISQAEIQPFDKRDNRYVTRDMHLYRLPWPSDILLDLGETNVSMRITLSYFIEPGPGEIGWQDRYRYPSHALRFDLNGAGESEDEFIQRINQQARDDGEHPGTEGPSDNWVIGRARNVGSIHSDIWKGTAADLSRSNLIGIYPTVGWWRERHYLERWNKKCRYSLIVSIYTPEEDIDIYIPVAIQVGITMPIDAGF